MSKTVIAAENLGKSYMIGHQQKESYSTLRDILTNLPRQWWARLRNPQYHTHKDIEEFWALKEVNFEIKQGDRVGIIGRNGAGKSTILKILSRITEPTTGKVKIAGRVASLLEVGTGFHPELTGRENIFLNGAILGMSRQEIKKKFDEIIAFAEVEKFLDTPVKRYSSGMYVRLAFAVAAHLEPEILIVDEVLAVGDAQFQKKCLGKMEAVGKEGRTILFVSHNMGAIKSLCNSAVILSEGRLVAQGEVGQIVDKYFVSTSVGGIGKAEVHWPIAKDAPGGKEMRLVSIRLLDEMNMVMGGFNGEKPLKIEINYRLFETVIGMEISLQLINSEGIIVFTSTNFGQRAKEMSAGQYTTVCTVPGELLNTGTYFVKINSNIPRVKVLVNGWEFISFNVERFINHTSLSFKKWPGIVAPNLSWETEYLQS